MKRQLVWLLEQGRAIATLWMHASYKIATCTYICGLILLRSSHFILDLFNTFKDTHDEVRLQAVIYVVDTIGLIGVVSTM